MRSIWQTVIYVTKSWTQTVGVMGGYIQGGGHSPLSSIYGTGADQVLAFEVVTSDGKFVTADFTQNTDLFWALRGGGGSTFGVATSVTVKAFPDVQTTASRFTFDTTTVGNDTFWAGVRAYFDYFPNNADLGTYAYFVLLPNNPKTGVWTFQMTPFFAPNKTLAETKAILEPWMTQLDALGIKVDPNITHYDSFYPAWVQSFPLEVIQKVNAASGSRLFPRANFEDPELLNTTFANIRLSSERNRVIVGFNIKAVSPDDPDNAVNPAWRENVFFAIQSSAGTSTPRRTRSGRRGGIIRSAKCSGGAISAPARAAIWLSRTVSSPTSSRRFMGASIRGCLSLRGSLIRMMCFMPLQLLGVSFGMW